MIYANHALRRKLDSCVLGEKSRFLEAFKIGGVFGVITGLNTRQNEATRQRPSAFRIAAQSLGAV